MAEGWVSGSGGYLKQNYEAKEERRWLPAMKRYERDTVGVNIYTRSVFFTLVLTSGCFFRQR